MGAAHWQNRGPLDAPLRQDRRPSVIWVLGTGIRSLETEDCFDAVESMVVRLHEEAQWARLNGRKYTL